MTRSLMIALLGLIACAGPSFERVGSQPASAILIDRVELTWSNVYLVGKGDVFALVDSGSGVDRDALAAALAARHVDPKQIRVVVITHAHADHAGFAKWLQSQGAATVLGAPDARVAARGSNDPLPATGLLAGWLAPLFMFSFEPFTPDVAVDHEIDLAAYGLPELHVVPVPGHTPGSIAVVVGNEAISGDLFKGGIFAKYWVHTPSEHYYQTDPAADHRAIAGLLARGIERFYIGHGGPVDSAAVKDWLAGADAAGHSDAASIELGANGEVPRHDGSKGLAGLVRARFGIGGPLGYFGGFDLRAGDLDGGHLDADLHAVGLALRDRSGGFVAITAGVGVGGVRGIGATHLPVELSAELPAGPIRLIGRVGVGWRLGGARYAESAHGIADELTALVGIRLGREHTWGNVVSGLGPYLAATYRDLGGGELFGLALGIDMWSAD